MSNIDCNVDSNLDSVLDINNVDMSHTNKKIALVVLTRGYTNLQQYNTLIQRNSSIAKYSNDKNRSIDNLIFHEGNILEEHQKYISSFTPHLNLKFICISEKAFNNDKKHIKIYNPTSSFGINYRHMCSFWFVDFWNYVEEYDMILRIDEDCVIDFHIAELFNNLHNNLTIYGMWTMDQEYVTHNLNKFTLKFLKDNNIKTSTIFQQPSGPYTNVIGLNVELLRKNEMLKKYIERVKESNYIYTYRWGDLPLWGEAFLYLCDRRLCLKSDKIKYFHGSHNFYVGGNNNNNNNNNGSNFSMKLHR